MLIHDCCIFLYEFCIFLYDFWLPCPPWVYPNLFPRQYDDDDDDTKDDDDSDNENDDDDGDDPNWPISRQPIGV